MFKLSFLENLLVWEYLMNRIIKAPEIHIYGQKKEGKNSG